MDIKFYLDQEAFFYYKGKRFDVLFTYAKQERTTIVVSTDNIIEHGKLNIYACYYNEFTPNKHYLKYWVNVGSDSDLNRTLAVLDSLIAFYHNKK